MAALAPIKLSTIVSDTVKTTSATVADDKTFDPEGWKPGGVASWVDRSGGVPLGYPRITQLLRGPTKDSRVYKVSTKHFLPILETIDPAVGIFGPKLAYELQCHIDFLIPERATSAERLAFFNRVVSLMFATINASDDSPTTTSASPLRPAVLNLEDVY